jgi:hypothetical protein
LNLIFKVWDGWICVVIWYYPYWWDIYWSFQAGVILPPCYVYFQHVNVKFKDWRRVTLQKYIFLCNANTIHLLRREFLSIASICFRNSETQFNWHFKAGYGFSDLSSIFYRWSSIGINTVLLSGVSYCRPLLKTIQLHSQPSRKNVDINK